MSPEPVLTIRASDPNAVQLVRGMVDRRRQDLLGACRTDEVSAELKRLSRMDEIADEMIEWNLIYGRKG